GGAADQHRCEIAGGIHRRARPGDCGCGYAKLRESCQTHQIGGESESRRLDSVVLGRSASHREGRQRVRVLYGDGDVSLAVAPSELLVARGRGVQTEGRKSRRGRQRRARCRVQRAGCRERRGVDRVLQPRLVDHHVRDVEGKPGHQDEGCDGDHDQHQRDSSLSARRSWTPFSVFHDVSPPTMAGGLLSPAGIEPRGLRDLLRSLLGNVLAMLREDIREPLTVGLSRSQRRGMRCGLGVIGLCLNHLRLGLPECGVHPRIVGGAAGKRCNQKDGENSAHHVDFLVRVAGYQGFGGEVLPFGMPPGWALGAALPCIFPRRKKSTFEGGTTESVGSRICSGAIGLASRGVTRITSSVRPFWNSWLRNRSPRMGRSPRPGNFFAAVFMLSFIRPAMPMVWPSASSTVEIARRSVSAGTANTVDALIGVTTRALVEVSWLTLTLSLRLILPVSRITGTKSTFTPKSLYVMPIVPFCSGTGMGKLPPERNCASCPDWVVRVGSARIIARPSCL